jgi:undecaprenyl-diphosphatase
MRPPTAPGATVSAAAQPPRPADLRELDVEVFRLVAGMHSPVLDRVMPPLSQAASYSRLWMGVSALLWATGGTRGRRTALMGLTAIAGTSLLANAIVKPVFSRRRPTVEVPAERRLEQPASTSFPSGHSASAAAFSGVVGAQIPALRLPITGLAAAVGFSRVYTGVHYPGDVAAGWALGRGVAVAVQRIWSQADPAAPAGGAGAQADATPATTASF